MASIFKIDRNMVQNPIDEVVTWYDIKENPWLMYNLPFFNENKEYDRLDNKSREKFEKVNKNIVYLSNNLAGAELRFKTNSERLFIDVVLSKGHTMTNMTAIAECGFDCYVKFKEDNEYTYYGSSYFHINDEKYTCQVSRNMPNYEKDIIVNLPLYSGIISLKIGVCENSYIKESEKSKGKPLLFYGTSLTQGGCVSRPGCCFTNVLSRMLNTEVYNYGFSGNGFGEYEMAEVIRDIDDISFISLDYEANAGTSGKLQKSLKHFIEIIREKKKDTPILITSRIPFIDDFHDEFFKEKRNELRNFEIEIVKYFNNIGDKNVFFYNGYDMISSRYNENTVDLIHLNDEGHYELAKSFYKQITKILNI